ncbi:MAG: protein-disulfide isomerase [Pedosphaera sp.]|nr:protein-disulfide isomerase [Pedosphaera sp.]
MSDGLYHLALEVPVNAQDHSQGLESAPLTLVVYGDYQCPYTGSLYQVITRLQRQFGEKLRFVFRHFPQVGKHPLAQLAAEAAEAAGAQGKFWEMHAYLFQKQFDFDRDSLAAGSDLLGLDFARLDREISGHVYMARIQADIEDGRKSGVAGTPTLFINGFMYDGSDDFEPLSRYLETLVPKEMKTKKRPFWSGLK